MLVTEPSRGTMGAAMNLDDFAEGVRKTNPFTGVRVNEPSADDVDVPLVHARAFDRLTEKAEEALRERRGVGAVLLGEAGTGKSHLLSRLYRWAGQLNENGNPRACYVFLHNVLADPARLPRYLLKCVLSSLTAGGHKPLHESPLFDMIQGTLLCALKKVDPPPEHFTIKMGGQALARFFKKAGTDPEVATVLFQLFRHTFPPRAETLPNAPLVAEAAVAWLSGEEIDADAARTLGLDPHERDSVALRDDLQIEQVLTTLCRLAWVRRQPFVLCIDQVDNLDPDKLMAATRFLHALIDHAPNLLAITSGVKRTLLDFASDGSILPAAWDRVAEYQIPVDRIKPNDARRILEARLERFLQPYREVEEVHHHLRDDPLFPLGLHWFEERLQGGIEFRPRDILTWARDAWEDQRSTLARLGPVEWLKRWPEQVTPPAPPLPPLEEIVDTLIDRKMEEQFHHHRLQPGSLPPDAGNLTGLVLALLKTCRGNDPPYPFDVVECRTGKAKKASSYDLRIEQHSATNGQGTTIGVMFLTNMGQAATFALRRFLECDPPPDLRVLVTDEERRKLSLGAKGKEYYNDLLKLGDAHFQHVKLTFEEYARLDALVGTIGLARVGDLEIEYPRGTSRRVSEADVIASHHRQHRYEKHPLLRLLLTGKPGGDAIVIDKFANLNEMDVRQFIMAQLAWQMGSTVQSLAGAYQKAKPELGLEAVTWKHEFQAIAGRMHDEGLIHATPQDDDLFLRLTSKSEA